ncbi:MAG: hypothetical protein ACRDI3_02765, partial [Actinomycetota bacterium]
MRQAWIGALLLVVVLAGACTRGSSESFAGDDRTAEQVEISRTTLAEADEAARAYGRAHLGHFLELDGRALRREGLNVPD